jgi:transposase-like protein
MMPPENTPVPVLVEATGISDVTLYHWRKPARAKGLVVPGDGRNPENWSPEDKFAVVLETASMNEAELAEYCRKKGLFAEQIAAWKENCLQGNATVVEQSKAARKRERIAQQQVKRLKRELRRKEKALADRIRAVRLIKETVDAGARTASVCQEMGISMRTFQRWTREGEVKVDGRPDADRSPPSNKLSSEERQAVLDTVNSPAYRSLPPSQIVPSLADEGRYIASESTFYRILREEDQQQHRGRSRAPENRPMSTHCATGPNQVWCWVLTAEQNRV